MFTDQDAQPKHIDLTRFNCGGDNYWAIPIFELDICSWCDRVATVQMVHRDTHSEEISCDIHADQYFFHASVNNAIAATHSY